MHGQRWICCRSCRYEYLSMNEEERDMTECIIVGMGGFIGAVCRYLVGLLPVKESFVFPIKTFGINIIGCFLIGIIAALALKNSALDPRWILFLKIGICGEIS